MVLYRSMMAIAGQLPTMGSQCTRPGTCREGLALVNPALPSGHLRPGHEAGVPRAHFLVNRCPVSLGHSRASVHDQIFLDSSPQCVLANNAIDSPLTWIVRQGSTISHTGMNGTNTGVLT